MNCKYINNWSINHYCVPVNCMGAEWVFFFQIHCCCSWSFSGGEQGTCSAPENLTTSFALSPIFFNHPNTTNSIKLINFLPIVLQDKQLHLKVNVDKLVLSAWNIVQSTAKVLLVSFDISDNSCRLFCNVQCSVKMGFSYSLLFFSDKMLPGLLQFCEMKQQ